MRSCFLKKASARSILSNVLLADYRSWTVTADSDHGRAALLADQSTKFITHERVEPRQHIKPASKDETIAVMQDQLIVTEFKRKVRIRIQSLEEAYRLSERYVHDLAMPGRALKLLESAAGYSENGLVTMNSVQKAIEQTMDVKIANASDGEEREKLLNLEALIHERMINQTRAVERSE